MVSTFSYSSLTTFEDCPQKFKFKYVDRIKIEEGVNAITYLGTAVHRVLQKLYDLGSDNVLLPEDEAVKLYHQEWNKLDLKTIKVLSDYHAVDDFIRLGEEMLVKYYKKFQPFDDGVFLGAEKSIVFELPQSDFKFRSKIDRLVKQPDGRIEIWDYKTGKNLLQPADKQFILQMGMYQLAVMSRYKDFKNIELVMYFLRHEESVRYQMREDELDLLTVDLRNRINEIKTTEKYDSYSTNEGNHCQWCEYHELCPVKRHKKMLEDSISDDSISYSPEQLQQKADEYLNLYLEHKNLTANLEEKKEELKDIARQTELSALESKMGTVRISVKKEEGFITKTSDKDEYYKLAMLCRDLKLDDYFNPDLRSILKHIYQKKVLPEDQLKQLEEFIRIKESTRITVKLKHETNNANDEA